MRLRNWGISLMAILAFLLGGVLVAHADAPAGLPVSPYFKAGTFSGGSNSATVLPGQQDTVQLTDAANQLGTIWANKDDYYFELDHDQKASMWLYFDNKSGNAGDGMAFVLQNDPRDYAAVSRTQLTDVPAAGETLGVWGSPDAYTVPGTDVVAHQAIQNSWALEFDTFPNTTPMPSGLGKSTTFDTFINYVTDEKTKKPHIASNYPAKSGTYSKRSYGDQYYTVMFHKGILNPSLSNGAWHHMTLQYTAPSSYPGTGQMTYTFDDKDPATGMQTGSDQTATVDIDTSTVDPDNTGRAMWGFTGATGQLYETNQVVFEQIPGLVDASAEAHVYDRTEDNLEVPTNGTGLIMGGDRLLLQYTLKYEAGRRSWDAIKAAMKLPAGVTVTSGKVTYADGSQEDVALGDYQAGDDELDYPLQKGLSATNRTATVSLYATADNPAQNTVVAGTTSHFTGPLAIATADMTGFQVYHSAVDLTTALTSANHVTVQPGKTTTVTGTATLKGATANAAFTLHPTLNGQDIATSSFDSTKQADGSYTGKFSYQPLAGDLHTGLNTLTLYVADASGNASTDVTVLINVAGILSYATVPKTVSFADTVLTGQAQQLARQGNWQLQVNDARGTGSKWQLTAQLTQPMTATNAPATRLDGDLTYQASATATPVAIDTIGVVVASHQATSDDDTTNALNWDADAGMLLHVNSSAVSGTYEGEITWNLANAPG